MCPKGFPDLGSESLEAEPEMGTYLLNWKRWCARKLSVYSRPENRKR